MTIVSQVILDTKDASQMNGPSDSHFRLSPNHATYDKVKFKAITLVNTVYPVNSNNNVLNFVENGSTSNNISITEGFYTGTTFATQLQTQLNADTLESITYTVSYSSASAKLTIACDSTNTFKVLSTSTCLRVLGLDANTAVDAITTVADNPIRLDGSQYLDIVSNFYDADTISSSRKTVLQRVPLTVAFSEYLHYIEPDGTYTKFNGRIESVDIRLYDDEGNAFVLPDNCNIQYHFELSQ